jgi:hypothetical protein
MFHLDGASGRGQGKLEAMLSERAIPMIGIFMGSSLVVAVAIAGEMTDCQTRVQREGPGDLTHWSWRTIDGKQCWYRGGNWKPKHELRWAETTPSAAPGTVGQPDTDGHTELAGLDAGPTEPTSIDNAPEEWRAQFADLLLAKGLALIGEASPLD